jgi:hypothetical protein
MNDLKPGPIKGLVTELDIEKRFWARVKKSRGQGCWTWLGQIKPQGYGAIELNGKPMLAHRLSYMLNVGSIPEGAVIHHKCNNKGCVNPKHLDAVTPKQNAIYAANDRKFGG